MGAQNISTASAWSTGTFTPPANSLLVVAATYEGNGAVQTAQPVTITSTSGLVFTKRDEQLNSGAYDLGIAIFTAPVGATPAATTVSVNNGGSLTIGWQVHAVAYTGYDTANPVGATGAAAAQIPVGGGGFTLPLNATTAASSETFAAVGADEDVPVPTPISPAAGWTELNETASFDPNSQSQVRVGAFNTVGWNSVANGSYAENVVFNAIEIRQAAGSGPVPVTVKYLYSGPGDSPAATLDMTTGLTERTIGLPGGATVTKRASGDVWSYPNLHGDIVATCNSTGVKTSATPFYYGAYGETTTIPDNNNGNYDYGWLGQYQRPTDTQFTKTIEMGARVYDPALGRFQQMDPVEGGTSNDFVYVDDSVNQVDLSGQWCILGTIKKLDRSGQVKKHCRGTHREDCLFGKAKPGSERCRGAEGFVKGLAWTVATVPGSFAAAGCGATFGVATFGFGMAACGVLGAGVAAVVQKPLENYIRSTNHAQ